jgi:two-component system, LytTR family, sensor histidine kinase AlgZ
MNSRAHEPDSPLDLIWHRPATVLWMMVVGEGIAAILTLALDIETPFRFFGAVSLATQCVLLVTLLELYALRPRLRRWSTVHLAYGALALLTVNACAVAAITRFTFAPIVEVPAQTWGGMILRLVAIVLIVGVLAVAAFHNHWRAHTMALRAQQAELEALQARIRPHFLFNTLNTGAALVHSRPEEAERLLLDLADLFRAALAGPRDISLEDELSLVRRYLEIELLRFGDRLRIDWDVPAAIPEAHVPALSIQPLVENAIRHGVERVPHGGRVEITLTTTAGHIVVRIRNPLVFSDALPPMSHGVGLNAAQVRIEALTGGRGSVQTGRQGEHWIATVRLPRGPASGDRRRRF